MAVTEPSTPQDALFEIIEDTKKRLMLEFQAVVSEQEIEEITRQSLAAYSNAAVPDFVPLFVERETRERLLAHLR